MNLFLDIKRSIVLLLRINDIKNLCSVDKFFYSLCNERNLWLEKFKEKNLEMINNEINTVGQYINEYKKVSYASYTTNCLLNFNRNNTDNWMKNQIIRFEPNFSIDCLENILGKDHPILTIEQDNTKKYVDINIEIGTKRSIRYNSCEKNINYYVQDNSYFLHYNTLLSIEYYNDEKFIISLINKILYHHPSIVINDCNNLPLVVSKYNLEDFNIWYKNVHPQRREYWNECYSKYEELYF